MKRVTRRRRLIARQRRSRLAGGAIAVAMVMVGLPPCGCSRAPEPPVVAVAPSFVELVSLRDSPDESHSIAVRALDGSTWYRELEPGLDLRYCKLDEAFTGVAYDRRTFGVSFNINREYRERLRSWSDSRIGSEVGFVLEGRLVAHGPLACKLIGLVQIPGFSTDMDAANALERLRAAAAALRAASQPG